MTFWLFGGKRSVVFGRTRCSVRPEWHATRVKWVNVVLLDGVARGRCAGPSPECIRLISSIKWTRFKEYPEYDASFMFILHYIYIIFVIISLLVLLSPRPGHMISWVCKVLLTNCCHLCCICTAITVMIGVPSSPPSGESEAENKKLTHQLIDWQSWWQPRLPAGSVSIHFSAFGRFQVAIVPNSLGRSSFFHSPSDAPRGQIPFHLMDIGAAGSRRRG